MTPTAAPPDVTTLAELLKTHLPHLRRDTLQRVADVIAGLIQAQSTRHRRVALHLPGPTSPESKTRRVARCFHDLQLQGEDVLRVLLPLLPPRKAPVHPGPDQLAIRSG
jgi:hypothetical protein